MKLKIRPIEQTDYIQDVNFKHIKDSYTVMDGDKIVAFIKGVVIDFNGALCFDIAHLEVVYPRQGYGKATVLALQEHFNVTTIKGYSLSSARGFWMGIGARELISGNPLSDMSSHGDFYISFK